MAERRMFSKSVIDSDMFLDMPLSAQALYFHLGMHGDDDGFISNPKRISRAVGCNNDDIKILIQKGFIIPFESGVVVIRDWKINNTLRNDRYKPTLYTNELGRLKLDASGRYIFTGIQNGNQMATKWIPNGNQMEPQHNITQINVDKRSVDIGGETAENPPPAPASYGKKKFVPPTLDEVAAYCNERHNGINPSAFIDYYEARGWRYGTGKPMVDWKAAVRTWERRDKENPKPKQTRSAKEDYDEIFGGLL